MEMWLFLLIVPVLALLVGAFHLYLEHQQKMAGKSTDDSLAVNLGAADLKNELQMLRESLTAHAMSVDENLKSLASRMNSMKSRLSKVENQSHTVGQ